MIYHGHVRNGVVVVDEAATLPEGTEVRIEVLLAVPSERLASHGNDRTLAEKLLKHAGKALGLPTDAARNHDHYLYGTPKR